MFEKNMKIAYPLDFYEELLDPHVRNVMRAYYDDDLSLAEIAEGEGISRQGVRHLIKKGEDAIEFYDRNLSLAGRHEELVTAGASLLGVAERLEAATRRLTMPRAPSISWSFLLSSSFSLCSFTATPFTT